MEFVTRRALVYATCFFFCTLLLVGTVTYGQQATIHVGTILGPEYAATQQSLNENLGEQQTGGEVQGGGPGVSLQLHVENVDTKDSYLVSQALTRLLDKNSVVTLVVPSVTPVIAWWANRFSLPVISLGTVSLPAGTPDATLEISPDPHLALIEVMRYYKWSSLHYFYQNDEGLQRFQNVQSTGTGSLHLSSSLLYRVEDSHTARSILRRLDSNQPATPIYVVLDLDPDLTSEVLAEVARATYLEKKNFRFLLLQPADDTLWNEGFLTGLQVTGFKLYDSTAVPEGTKIDNLRNNYGSTTQWMLARDTCHVLKGALERLAQNDPHATQELQGPSNGSSRGEQALTNGPLLARYLRETPVKASESTPSALQFNSNGKRRAFELDIQESTPSGPVKAFTYSDASGLNVLSPSYLQSKTTVSSKTFVVTSVLHPPYMMMAMNAESKQGNDRYEGYGKDLMDLLALKLSFNYDIIIVKDGKYGSRFQNSTRWSGMIGEVMRNEADIAMADLTITSQRQQAVDMSLPFMTVGISLMVKRPTTTGTSPSKAYFFLSPFTSDVWGCLVVALVAVGLTHFGIGRLLTKVDTARQTRSSSLLDSLWFAFGSLFLRQTGLQPKSFSNRILTGVWWVFAFFVLALYVTSLVSLLVNSEMGITGLSREEALSRKTALEILEESTQTGYPEVGMIGGGSTQAFFQNSRELLYSRVYQNANEKPDLFMKSNFEGTKKVVESDGSFAFLIESSTNEYITMRECRAMMVPEILDSKGYGIVTAKGSSISEPINNALLTLRESGDLQRLYTKWWRTSTGCERGRVNKKMKELYHSSMSLSDVAGVFYLLIAGALLTLLVALGEVLYSRRSGRSMHRVALTNVSSKSESDQLNGEGHQVGDQSSI